MKLDEDETSSLRDRLLPLIIGLLRTVSDFLFLFVHDAIVPRDFLEGILVFYQLYFCA